MKKIIIDTDPGIDDAQALCYALAHPQLEVLGLTCIYGNVSVELACQNALRICELTNRSVPVACGMAKPLEIAPNPVASFVHGENGLGNISLPSPSTTVDTRSAARFIIDTVRQYPGEVTLVPIGPLTNLAVALQQAPDIADLVAEVVIMGGAFNRAGNVSQFAEANIWNDPHAANRVMTASWPVSMHGLDVTHQVVFSAEYLRQLASSSVRAGGFLCRASEFYIDFYQQNNGFDGCCPHDLLALAYTANPQWFQTTQAEFQVTTDGPEIGRTLASQNARSNKRYATGVDVARLLTDYQQITGSLA